VPPRRRWQWLTALVAFVLVGLTAALVMVDPARPIFQGLDDWWHTLSAGPRSGVPQPMINALDAFGRPTGVVVVLLIMVLLGVLRRWWAVLFAALSYIAPSVVAQILKYVVDRPRPPHPLVTVDHGSFPSGHAVTAAAFVIMVGALLTPPARRIWWPGGIGFVVVMAWSRTYVSAHWASDTVAGALVGAGVALVVWWLLAPLLAREVAQRADHDDGDHAARPASA